MQRLVPVLALGLALVASAAAAQDPPLPEGPGKAVMLGHCADCHGVDQIAAKRQGEAEWKSTVGRMVGYGAVLTPAETDTLIAYLAANFGPDGAKAQVRSQPPAAPQKR